MNEYICADCGTEAAQMEGTCVRCNSVRIILFRIIEDALGPNWREHFEPNLDPVTPDHPEYKAAEAAGRLLRGQP